MSKSRIRNSAKRGEKGTRLAGTDTPKEKLADNIDSLRDVVLSTRDAERGVNTGVVVGASRGGASKKASGAGALVLLPHGASPASVRRRKIVYFVLPRRNNFIPLF